MALVLYRLFLLASLLPLLACSKPPPLYQVPKTKVNVSVKPSPMVQVGRVAYICVEPMFVRERLLVEVYFGLDKEPRLKGVVLESRQYMIPVRFAPSAYYHYKYQYDRYDPFDASQGMNENPQVRVIVKLKREDGKIVATDSGFMILSCPQCVQ